MAAITKFCQRGTNCRWSPAHAEATHLLRRECPGCGNFEVIYICLQCADYIEDRNKRKLNERGVQLNWRCLHCGHLRPVPSGMDIIGAA